MTVLQSFFDEKSIYDLFFNKEVLLYITVYNVDGELVEWSKAPHWKCGVPQGTEGSNPSLSAIFFIPLLIYLKKSSSLLFCKTR